MKTKKTPIAKKLLGPQEPKVVKNRIILVLDQSGSMDPLRTDALAAVNVMLREIREATEKEGQQTDVSIMAFDNHQYVEVAPTDVRNITGLTYYAIRGGTALYDAVAKATEVIDDGNADTSYLVLTFTDGEELHSRVHSQSSVRAVIQRLQAKGNWSFGFQVPKGAKARVSNDFGVPADNVREWEQTREGTRVMGETTKSAITGYMAARSRGLTRVDTLYVQTDLSDLNAREVKQNLTDISPRFKVLTVDKEMSVKEFVESKTKRPYVIGSAYYCLTKTEKVQPKKSLLIMEKGKTAIWGGNEARELVGLPTDGATHAKVEPFNHGAYEIFVQSTSVNRKLVRGTKVLVDLTHAKDSVPTWDHTSVAKSTT